MASGADRTIEVEIHDLELEMHDVIMRMVCPGGPGSSPSPEPAISH